MKKDLFPGGLRALLCVVPLWIKMQIFLACAFANTLSAQCASPISSFPYSEGFEASAAWTSGGANSSWAWGTPAHPTIASAGGGSKSWCSGGLTGSAYSGSQQSWIESPCFNFSTLNYPWISFKIFWECENTWDGLVLQSSINGGATWVNVGSSSDPVNCLNANWYNHNNISNLSQANPRNGWCGRIGATSGSCAGGNGSAGWVTAKHCMGTLANQASVKFRFLFGSGTTCNSYDGIAIDDILIREADPIAANFSYSCSGNTGAGFTNLSSQCPTSFNWNFGDVASGASNTSVLQNPSHTFSAPGTYTVNLTSSGLCSAASTTLIPVTILSLSTAVTSLGCSGGNTGSSTVTAGGGTSAYSYTWLPTVSSTSVAANLGAGIYTIQVKDLSSCVASRTVAITQPVAMTSTFSRSNVTCNGFTNGSLSASVALGLAPYSYTWLPMGVNTASVGGLSAGIYSLIVKDANNCSTEFTTAITQPAAITMTFFPQHISCLGGSNGTVSVICSGGTGAYSYTWNPLLSNNAVLTGLQAGTYSVFVSDANMCMVASSILLNQPLTSVGGSILTQTPTCALPNGSASVTANGGTGGFRYSWSPSAGTFSFLTGLTGGVYSVTVTDSLNCSALLTTTLASSSSASTTATISNLTCHNLANGFASLQTSGGIGPYSYTWVPTPITGQGNVFITGLSAGSRTVQVKDANNCASSVVFSITAPPALSLTFISSNVSCYAGNNGSVTLVANGGTPAYTFSSSLGSVNALVTGLSAGTYTFRVKDNNNCVATTAVSLLEPFAPLSVAISHTNVLCYGFSTAAGQATVTGGTPVYSYTWLPNGGNQSMAAGLAAGAYTLFVKDMQNCTSIKTLTLTQPALPLTGTISTGSVTCYKGNNGSATVTVNGGVPAYSYAWNHLAGNVNSVSSLQEGNYSVSVRDLNNCSTTLTFSILQPPQIHISASASKFCIGKPGVLEAKADAGSLPMSYNWSGSSTTSNIHILSLDSTTAVTVFAMDAKGCVSTKTTVIVEVPKPLQILANTNYSVCQGQKTTLSATAIAGDGNYTFVWQPGYLHGPVQHLQPSAGQVYTVSVTDGCSTSKSGQVELKFYAVPVSNISFTGTSGCAPVCVSLTNLPLLSSGLISSYHWNFGDGSASDQPTPSHCYTAEGNHAIQLGYITVNGCTGSQVLSNLVMIYPKPEANFITDREEIDAYYPTVNFINKSLGATTYSWFFNSEGSSEEENPSFAFRDTGEQQIALVIQNEHGCYDTLIKKIEIKPEFTFFAPNAFSPNGNNINDIFLPKGMGWSAEKFELLIYDRWGSHVFSTSHHEEGWNGKIRGADRPVQDGSYTWKVRMYDMFNKYHEFIGNVLIEK